MATLETTFAGLKLKNPIIISSSGLTDSAAKNQKLYEAGAGAIVLKSLFEEQIMMDTSWSVVRSRKVVVLFPILLMGADEFSRLTGV